MPEHEPVVAEAEQVLEEGILDRGATHAGHREGTIGRLACCDATGLTILDVVGIVRRRLAPCVARAQKTRIPRGTL